MADTFVPLSNTNDPLSQACPQGQGYSAILQKCMGQDDYIAAIKAAMDAGNVGLASSLRSEAIDHRQINPAGGQNLVSAILQWDWVFVFSGLLPIVVGLIGLILVFLAVSAWVNSKSITIAGQTLPLPKVL